MQFIINHIRHIIAEYSGHPPLAAWLKNYFRMHPKLGSRDRRAISEAAYIYYRCASFFDDETLSELEIIKQGLIWCNSEQPYLTKALALIEDIPIPPLIENRHPELRFSEYIDATDWLQSMLRQPRLFIRLRKKKEELVKLLQSAGLDYGLLASPILHKTAVSLPNGTKTEQLLPEDAYAIQDFSSQLSLQIAIEHIGLAFFQEKEISAWDVCSGAGGKTLLFKDMFPTISVKATDVRESILHNLRVRMRQAGVQGVTTLSLNTADKHELDRKMPEATFDFIICDVPCSGSGTWARTPEQFFFFNPKEVADFATLQYNIAANASTRLKPGGILCYITCSVFFDENEGVTDLLQENLGLDLLHRQAINGIAERADSMFIAVFKKAPHQEHE